MDISHLVDLQSLSEEERRNVETVRRWGELYNTDVARMVDECYHQDCTVDVKGFIKYHGHAPFHALEAKVHSVAPRRYGIPERIIARGDTVVVQASIANPDLGEDWRSAFCVVLTLKQGKIIRDESYLDMSAWPAALLSPQELADLGIEPQRSFLELALVAVPGVAVRKFGALRQKVQSLLRA